MWNDGNLVFDRGYKARVVIAKEFNQAVDIVIMQWDIKFNLKIFAERLVFSEGFSRSAGTDPEESSNPSTTFE